MNIVEKLSTGLTLLALHTGIASAATCSLNGKEIQCDNMPEWFWVLGVCFFLLIVFFFFFWFRMLLDAIKNQPENKAMWIFLIIFFNIFGAILYFFTQKKKRGKL